MRFNENTSAIYGWRVASTVGNGNPTGRKTNVPPSKEGGGSPGRASSLLRKTIAGITGVIAIFSLGLASNTAFADEYDDSLDGLTDEQLAQLDQQLGIMPMTACSDSGSPAEGAQQNAESWVSIDYAVDGQNSHPPTDTNNGMGTYKAYGGNLAASIYCNGTRFAINRGAWQSGPANEHAQQEFTMNKDMWVAVIVAQWDGHETPPNTGVSNAWQLHKGDKCVAQVWYDNQADEQSFTYFSCGGTTVNTQNQPSPDGRGWYTMDVNFYTNDPRPDPDPEPTPDYYTLSSHANGGTGRMSSESYEEGTRAFVKSNGFTRSGYTFLGWATSPSGGVSYRPNNTIYMDSDKDLYAVWQKVPDPEPEPVEYTLSYDKNAADATGSMSSQTAEEGTPLPIKGNEFERPGYTFVGWADSPSGAVTHNPGSTITMTGDKTLYAVWQRNQNTLHYDPNGGTGSMQDKTADENASISVDDNGFTRPGYDFTGWNTDPNGHGDSYAPGSNITLDTDKTLYAQWTPSTVKLLYDANGGNGSHDPTEGKANQDITIPSDVNDPFHRDHYTLTGWNTQADGKGQSYAPGDKVHMGIEDQTLYAQWEKQPVKVNYDPNGGNGSHDPTKGDAGEDITIPSDLNDPFTKPGSILTGWNTKPDGSGDSYEPGDTIPMGDEDKTLYAQWKDLPSVLPTTGGDGSSMSLAPLAAGGLLAILIGVGAMVLRRRNRLS